MEETPERHCWECRRLCLVCDSTRPSCRRCSSSGTQCPGYGTKPLRLRWVAPGKVTSQNRKSKRGVGRGGAGLGGHEEVHDGLLLQVPRFKMKSSICAVFQAAEYCKFPTYNCWGSLIRLTLGCRQLLHPPRFSRNAGSRAEPTCVPYPAHPSRRRS